MPFFPVIFQNTSFPSALQEIIQFCSSVSKSFTDLSSYLNSDSYIFKDNLKIWTAVEDISTEVRWVGILVESSGYLVGNLKRTRGAFDEEFGGMDWNQLYSEKWKQH